jgi:hypothetical protein
MRLEVSYVPGAVDWSLPLTSRGILRVVVQHGRCADCDVASYRQLGLRLTYDPDQETSAHRRSLTRTHMGY